jgi:hypothetical protein
VWLIYGRVYRNNNFLSGFFRQKEMYKTINIHVNLYINSKYLNMTILKIDKYIKIHKRFDLVSCFNSFVHLLLPKKTWKSMKFSIENEYIDIYKKRKCLFLVVWSIIEEHFLSVKCHYFKNKFWIYTQIFVKI